MDILKEDMSRSRKQKLLGRLAPLGCPGHRLLHFPFDTLRPPILDGLHHLCHNPNGVIDYLARNTNSLVRRVTAAGQPSHRNKDEKESFSADLLQLRVVRKEEGEIARRRPALSTSGRLEVLIPRHRFFDVTLGKL